MIDRMVEALMITSNFSRSVEHFTEIDVTELDKAYANSRLEWFAVKGNVIRMIALPTNTQKNRSMFSPLSDKNKTESKNLPVS